MPNDNQTPLIAQPKMDAQAAAQQQRKPNETSGIAVQAHFKIFDPATQRVYVEGRA